MGLFMVGVGIVLISGRKNKGFVEVRDGKAETITAKVEEKKEAPISATTKIVNRKVPLEEIKLTEGFPREIVFYFGS
jgi:hypothetical protein